MSTLRDIDDRIVHRETVPGARYWSLVIKRGFTLRLVDTDGRANVSMLLYNPRNLLERYSAPDTLKGQHTSKLTKGNMLYSDMGRAMLSIVEDTVGWHDTIGGVSDAAMVREQYGGQRYQEHRNAFYRSGRELLLIELKKWGLGRRDLVPSLNFFSKVFADEGGTLHFAENHGKPGACVDLRAEMDTLAVLSTAPHPMDPSTEYRPGAVGLAIYRTPPVDPETDVCVNFRPENARAYANTRILNCQEDAARQPHHSAAANADSLAVTMGTPSSRLDVVPATPAPASGPRPSSQRRLGALATRTGGADGFVMTGKNLVESTLDPRHAVYRHVVPAGEPWMHELKKGQTLRILDLEGNQAADTLFYSLERPTEEHYSAVHTIRAQGNAYLTTGSVLRSNEGRPMLTVTADTCGRHDTLGGACAAESNQVRYALEKKPMHNCRDNFLTAIAESHYGLGKRDVVPNINFFMNVPLTPEGGLTFEDGISDAGKYVEMRAEMDVIVLVSNCPQLNNPCNAYNPTPVEMLVWD